MEITLETCSDSNIIARLHSESWQRSYHGILDEDYLRNRVVHERTDYWRSALENDEYSFVRIARLGDEPIGFVAAKDATEAGYNAVIEHLHVAAAVQGRGLGRRLISEVARWAKGRGDRAICLWVFEDNRQAIAFYEKLGGVTDAHGVDKFSGGEAADRRIGWHDLDELIRACGEYK